jgi:hypothetical protein
MNEFNQAAGRLVRDTALFVGGPLSGQTIQVERWPYEAMQQTGAAHQWDTRDVHVAIGPTYNHVLYFPMQMRGDPTLYAVTEQAYQRWQISGEEPVEDFTKVALQRLYNAVKGDHSDPTDDSGRELDLAFAMAERVLGDDTKDQYEAELMRSIVRYIDL